MYDLLNKPKYIKSKNECNFRVQKFFEKRYLLYNTNDVTYDPEENNYHNMHIDIKYLNHNNIILTISHYMDKEDNTNNIIINVKNIGDITLTLTGDPFIRKQSYLIHIDTDISRVEHVNYDFGIMQTDKKKNVSINRFFSIVSILNYIPNLTYNFYSNKNLVKYLQSISSSLLHIFLKIIPGAFKSDLFRVYYLYLNNGIYLDCKMILLCGIENLLTKNNFVKDRYENCVYNAVLINTEKHNNKLKNIISEAITNIKNEDYKEDQCAITGPILCRKYINDELGMTHSSDGINISRNDDNKIIIKCSIPNYYSENNYSEFHYSKLYIDHYVYNNIDLTNCDIVL